MTNEEILQKAVGKAERNGWDEYVRGSHYSSHTYEATIFSHSFAKAFWGEYWMPRLQAQVVEKDPIRYMEKFL